MHNEDSRFRLKTRGGCFGGDAEAVICDDPENVNLSELVRQHLVSFESKSRCYELLNLARAFCWSKLPIAQKERMLAEFANYFADYADRVVEAHRSVTYDALGVPIQLFDFEASSLFDCLHLISHRMCRQKKWARLGLRFVGLLSHPRMVGSSHYETSVRTIAHCAEETGDDAVLAECMLLIGRLLAHQPGWFKIAEYSHDAEGLLLACVELARKLGNATLERAALDQAVRSSLLRCTPDKTFAYLTEKIPLDSRDDMILELLYDALLTYEIAMMYDNFPPEATLIDITDLKPHSYVALVLFETMRQIPCLEATLEYYLLSVANYTGKPKISLSDYAYSLVAEGASTKGPFSNLESFVAGSSEELLEIPMLAFRYPECLPPDQAVACLSAAIPVAEAIGRNFTLAKMLMIRSGLFADRGDIDLACEDLERAITVTEPKVIWIDRAVGTAIRTSEVAKWEEVRRGAEQTIASLRYRSPKGSATKPRKQAAHEPGKQPRGSHRAKAQTSKDKSKA